MRGSRRESSAVSSPISRVTTGRFTRYSTLTFGIFRNLEQLAKANSRKLRAQAQELESQFAKSVE